MTNDIQELLRQAAAKVAAMTPEEREAMFAEQRESWVRAELAWPKPKFERRNGVKVYDSYEDYCAD